jgi:mannose-1-phosphate guanylyltransferase
MFMFKASSFLEELKHFEPKILNSCKKSFKKPLKDFDFIRLNEEEFNNCQNISIDYAVMERTKKGVVIPLDANWSDIGSWPSLWEAKPKDANNNVSEGDVILNEVKNSYIHSSSRLVSVIGLSDIAIIDTQDALLVANKSNAQSVKLIVDIIKKENRSESKNHRRVYRPWGNYDSIDFGENFQVKKITVNPRSKLSLQKHKYRSEHWVIVKGTALVTCGDKVFSLEKNQSTYIPQGTIHRLENSKNLPLEIIEIQTGSYLGEDDIIRLEDDYSRN